MKKNRYEVITIGDELLDGRVIDTNSLRLAEALSSVGCQVSQRTSIPDDLQAIQRELKESAGRGTGVCVVSGGLGPTSDDVTAEAFAALLGVALYRDQDVVKQIETIILSHNRPVTPNQLKQADRPMGSKIIPNPIGTAPGFEIEYLGCRFIVVPGVPNEYDLMVKNSLIDPLLAVAEKLETRLFVTFGLYEAQVDELLKDLPADFPKVRLGYRVNFPEVHVFLKTENAHISQLRDAESVVRQKLGNHILGTELKPFASELINLLSQNGLTMSYAESATGGAVGNLLSDAQGYSDVLKGGYLVNSTHSLNHVLAISHETLEKFALSSEQIAQEMARQVVENTGADFGLSVANFYGEDSKHSSSLTSGDLWIGLASRNSVKTKKVSLRFDLKRNKLLGAAYCLDFLRRHILEEFLLQNSARECTHI